ncbi:glyoxalase [Gluconacetobacter azotocaptans]|jgi:hypothetical protein|uniref:glyoxalase n=1 Tax=Gluconacetobacter azotocaptans TaxID=142834 RepID=UPI00195C9221|nr:glyoxalase [Gluconacetobacter azotocaptans]MBM9401112.1 glyoxalase [Gluconacetobacter azotocaptans]
MRFKFLALMGAATLTIGTAVGNARQPTPISVGPQYDTTHVYIAPADVDRFVISFLATFGGHSTKQIVATVTPTPSSTTSQLLLTPVGSLSVFGFSTPIPYPFGAERTGYLVRDMDEAVDEARRDGADVIVDTFPDPIGRDAVVQWPGGINMQLYWHTVAPSYAALSTIPENRLYISPDRADAFVHAFLAFSKGHVVSDDRHADGTEIGRPGVADRRIELSSGFGRIMIFVTDGHLPYPYGHEMAGYAVSNLGTTLEKAHAAGVKTLSEPVTAGHRTSVMVEFPGGYVAEIHSSTAP